MWTAAIGFNIDIFSLIAVVRVCVNEVNSKESVCTDAAVRKFWRDISC